MIKSIETERESKSRDRTWALIDRLLCLRDERLTGMVAPFPARFRNWMRNKIVFPWPIGNILKERFRNRLGAREEISSDGGVALPPVAPAADYSHSIVLGGFEEMS
jgi:hypothetical protein